MARGQSATFAIVVWGSVPQYQWQFNGVPIPGATDYFYTVTNAQAVDIGNYTVYVDSGYCPESFDAFLTVTDCPPLILAQPESQILWAGDDTSLSVTATGTWPLSFQWQFNGTNIDGATTSTLTLTNIQSAQAGSYLVIVTNLHGSTNSSNAVVAVEPPGSCTPFAESLAAWWPGEGSADDIIGTNSGILCGSATLGDGKVGRGFSLNGSSSYVEVPDSDLWAFDTNSFTIELWARFDAAPAGIEAFLGNDEGGGNVKKWFFAINGGVLTFHINNPGVGSAFLLQAPLTPKPREWYHLAVIRNGSVFTVFTNGVAARSETNSMAIPNANAPLTIGRAEGYYFNGWLDEVSLYRNALSANEIAAIWNARSAGKCPPPTPPSIATQPQSQVVVAGQTASFSVVADGTAPFTYQWRYDGGEISGATQSVYSVANAQPANAGTYSVQVWNVAGTTNSLDATLTVNVPPAFSSQPTNLTVLVGSNAFFAATATGTAPLSYQWQVNGTNIAGATGATMILTNVQPADAGYYAVVITNVGGVATSLAAELDVRCVLIFGNGQVLVETNYTFVGSVTLAIQTGFANGSIFHTLNGSEPSFTSVYYDGPFYLRHSATVRAVGYSADFTQSGEARPANITIVPTYTLAATTPGGGSVSLSPEGGVYASNTTVSVTAIANSGWTFLGWFGAVTGNSPSATVTMNQDKAVQAVFGTSLSTTAVGNGSVSLYPSAPLYPYGSLVRLTGTPQLGSYFVVWGNAANGNFNPLYFAVTNPNPTVSSVFTSLAASQCALTVIPEGFGRITVAPRANVYSVPSLVMLTAIPDAGQSFLGWGGDVSATNNPFSINLNESRVITASFTRKPTLSVAPPLNGFADEGFRLSLIGEFDVPYRIEDSTNLVHWELFVTFTNMYGRTQLTDPAGVSRAVGTNGTYRFYRALKLP